MTGTPGRYLPPNFNEVVNAALANQDMSPEQKAYIIGSFFLPVKETMQVLDKHLAIENRGGEHSTPSRGKFALWEDPE
jgi:hypothetical protein